MPFFRRKQEPILSGVDELLLQGSDRIQRTGQTHTELWNLGRADAWDLDQTTGVLRWTFPDRVAESPAQALGSFSPRSGSWVWAWANESLLPHLRTASESVRAWGEAHGHAALTTPRLDVSKGQAADLVALAFRVSAATGYYRAPTGRAFVILTFGPVTVTREDGQQKTFTIDVD